MIILKAFFIYYEMINFIKGEILKVNVMRIEVIRLFRFDTSPHTPSLTSFYTYFSFNISFTPLSFDCSFSSDISPPSPPPPPPPPPIQNQDLGLRKMRVVAGGSLDRSLR